MKFLHLSDIHFLRTYPKSETGYNSIFNNITNPLTQINRCLEKINLEEIKFVIITGDLVESGDHKDYEELKKHLDKVLGSIPYIVTLGNHDNKDAFYKGWLNKEYNGESYNVIQEVEGLRIISFDNSEYKNSNGNIANSQYSWLKEALINNDKENSILIMHHHLIKNQYTTPSIEYKDEFEDMIKDSNLDAIFVGHTHSYYKGEFAGKPYYSSGSLCFIGHDESKGVVRFEETATCNVCTYIDGEITVEAVNGLKEKKVLGYVTF